ncbi:alpha/beta-hydrolase [Acephala macrosclerotiorum]|nr:alpha/beta-hydrolase [Acephala macrosclerotiorum]
MPNNPSIVFVPGFWEGPTVFESVAATLRDTYGYKTEITSLPSTGQASPGNPTLQDDIQAVHSFLERLVAKGEDVLLVLHSASGFIGTEAIKNLTAKERMSESKTGGVVKIVFMTAGVFPVGFKTGPLPFFEYDGTRLFCKDPASFLFNDLPPDVAQMWISRLECQPAWKWDGEITHGGYKDVSSVYLLCSNDQCVPLAMQRQCAELAGSEIVSCNAGHMVMLSQPETVVKVIHTAAKNLQT